MKNEVVKKCSEALEAGIEDKDPSLYQVFLKNDDFTPMEFVIGVLERFFSMNRGKATEVMLEAHSQGVATCGVFTKDVAETKVSLVADHAQQNEFPLNCIMEVAR